MKLRTKIIGIAALVLCLAMGISNYIIWKVCEHTLLEEAAQTVYYEAQSISQELMIFLDHTETKADQVLVDYYFKSTEDPYTICVRENLEGVSETLHNRTVFSLEDLEALDWNEYHLDITSTTDLVFTSWNGLRLVLVHYYISPGMHLYRVMDLAEIYRQLGKLAVWMAVAAAVIMSAGLAFAWLMIRRAFRPVQELASTAEQIAEGAYEKRVKIESKDEIGTLGTSFNRMAAAAEQQIRELELSEERKTLFMGSLTHELKTPLTAISGYAQTMRAIKLSEEDMAEALDYIYKECGRLERLSGKMMRLLELEQGCEMEWKPIPVQQLFEAAAGSCRAILEEKQIDLRISDTDEMIYGDADLLTDVLVNLMDNAVKASPVQGKIELYTEKIPAESTKNIQRSFLDGEYSMESNFGSTGAVADDVCLVVQDYGKGIPEDEIHRLCEPFYMVDRSRSRREGGAGLGLALAAVILKRHQMELKIESKVGAGTRVLAVCMTEEALLPIRKV